MTDYFVDDTVVGGLDDGTDWDTNAFQLMSTGFESSGYASAGDKVWFRRTCQETPGANISIAEQPPASDPLLWIGWPRAAIPDTTITSADFTNGSRIIDNVVGITPNRESHCARYITAPDGKQYTITAILYEAGIDGMAGGDEFTAPDSKEGGMGLSNTTQTAIGKLWGFTDDADTTGTIQYTRDYLAAWVEDDNITDEGSGDAEIDAGAETPVGFLILEPYVGATVTGVDGKFQINEDDHYSARPDVGGLRAAWDADAITLPQLDFNSGDFNVLFNQDRVHFLDCFDFRNSSDPSGIISNASSTTKIRGFLLSNNYNEPIISVGGDFNLVRCVAEGRNKGTGDEGIRFSGIGEIKDSAIFGSNQGLSSAAPGVKLDNVNIGVEIPCNGYSDVRVSYYSELIGKNVSCGGHIKAYGYSIINSPRVRFRVENFNHVLGDHREYNGLGVIRSHDVVLGSGDPYKRTDGADKIIRIIYDINNALQKQPISELTPLVFEHEFEVNTDSKSYRYYVQCEGIVTASELWIECEYINSSSNELQTFTTQLSDEAFTARADENDWAEYMEVTGIAPAVASKVRIRCYCSYYDASNEIYIDPLVVIS